MDCESSHYNQIKSMSIKINVNEENSTAMNVQLVRDASGLDQCFSYTAVIYCPVVNEFEPQP